MSLIRQTLKNMPPFKRVVNELNSLRSENLALRDQLANFRTEALAQAAGAPPPIEKIPVQLNKQVVTPGPQDLQIKCYEFWQIPGRKVRT